jgi:hypothetical protein
MNPENTLLTDEQCDEILKTANVLSVGVSVVDWKIYRSSQYRSFDEARFHGAIVHRYDIFGYNEAIDTLFSIESVAHLMDWQSPSNDLRIVLSVNKEPLPECWLVDAKIEIDRYLVRKGDYAYWFPQTNT